MRLGLRLLMSFPNIKSVQEGLEALKPILSLDAEVVKNK
jgi:hypothetical protein